MFREYFSRAVITKTGDDFRINLIVYSKLKINLEQYVNL